MSIATRIELEHQVIGLHRRGRSTRQIARALGISRGLVRRIVTGRECPADVIPVPTTATPRATKLDEYEPRIRELLAAYPTITSARILEELRTAGYDGGYSQLKERVRRLRPPAPPEPSRERPVTAPGEMAEQDWSPHRIEFADGLRLVHACLIVLAHSRRRYLDFFEREDSFALLEGHRRAFEHFGGVPHRMHYDWQKAVVVRREGPDVIYHPRLLAFATHYGFTPRAVRPGKPNDKAFVERGLWDVERNFLCGRRFRDLDELRAAARTWLADIVDVRRHPKRRDQRIVDVFTAEEQAALRPLPAQPFDTARVVYRLCSIEGFVHWEGNRYSVPYAHVTALLPVRITQSELFVYGPDLSCVAHHELLPKGAGRDSLTAAHRPPRAEGAGASLEAIRERFIALGEGTEEFLAGLCEAHPRSAAFHARRILELRERFTAPDISAAITHAQGFRAFSFDAVARIVTVRARPRTLDEYVAVTAESRLQGLLATDRTEPRDLTHYDLAPVPAVDAAPPDAEEDADE
jgi:transposase